MKIVGEQFRINSWTQQRVAKRGKKEHGLNRAVFHDHISEVVKATS